MILEKVNTPEFAVADDEIDETNISRLLKDDISFTFRAWFCNDICFFHFNLFMTYDYEHSC